MPYFPELSFLALKSYAEYLCIVDCPKGEDSWGRLNKQLEKKKKERKLLHSPFCRKRVSLKFSLYAHSKGTTLSPSLMELLSFVQP